MNFKKDNKLLRVMFLIFFCRLYKFFSRTYFPFFLSTSTNAKYLKNIYFCNNYKKIIFLVIINLLFFRIHSKQNIPPSPQHFDKEKCGRLAHVEFKSCLRALGYDLPMVEDGMTDPEFEAILNVVDPNRDGHVSLQVNNFILNKITHTNNTLPPVLSWGAAKI